MRTCKTCGRSLPESDFPLNGSKLRWECSDCWRAKSRERMRRIRAERPRPKQKSYPRWKRVPCPKGSIAKAMHERWIEEFA